jgi:hypothetical protein
VRTFRPVIDDGSGLSRLSLEIGTSVVNTDISHISAEELETAKASLERAMEKVQTHLKEGSAQKSLL